MDGRNCTGRKISLLNDASDLANVPAAAAAKFQQLPPLTVHSRASSESSCSSTPSLSPQTPKLSRSSSSDSRGFASPSPLTPSFHSLDNNNPHAQQHFHRQQQHYYLHLPHTYAKMDDQGVSMYPPIPDASGLPSIYPMQQMAGMQQPMPMTQLAQPQQTAPLQRSSTSPHSEPSRTSNASAASSKQQPKKNQYPCPMAKQVGCTDFFTTSGHAARHAKKHTGKKDAFCPECNKAFTRKDNMEQHRRTHQNGRGGSRTNNDDSKVKKPAKQTAKKPSATKNEPQLEAAVEQQLAEQQQQQQQIQAITQAPPIPVSMQAPPVMPVQASLATQLSQANAEQLMMTTSTPYFLSMDTGPIPALPMAPELSMRPQLHRTSFANTLDYVPPAAPMMANPDDLHYSYPSPGLSNGLNSLALAASEHRRMSEEKARSESSSSQSPQETPQQETP